MTDCPFCAAARGERDVFVVHETDRAIAFFDREPAAPYHTLVVPKAHADDLLDISREDFQAVMGAAHDVVHLYRQRLGIESVELSLHSGREAQQDVRHLHLHIVPRHADDGQDTDWARHPELKAEFSALLARLL